MKTDKQTIWLTKKNKKVIF